MGIVDLGIESANRVGKFNTNTKLTGSDLNATVLGMATTFCQVIQAFSQSRANTRINPNDSSFLGMDLDDIVYTPGSNGGTLSIGKIKPGILFNKNIPYVIPEMVDLTFQLPDSSGKSFGLCVKLLDMELSDSKEKSALSSDGEEIKISLPTKMSFPFKIFWEEIAGENGEISPKVISGANKIYIFTITRSTSIGNFGWQLNHNSFRSPYVLDVNNTFIGRERKEGTLGDLLSGIPESREEYYNDHEVGDILFFQEERSPRPTSDFPFIKLSTPLSVISREEYPDFYSYLINYKLPLRLYLDGWEWDALPYSGESEKQGTAYNFGALSMQRVRYGYNALEKKQYEDKASEGKKGTFGKCTFRVFLSKNKKTIFNTVNNTYTDNKLLLSIINDLPMHPVRFPDLSNLILDNDPLSPLGSSTLDPESSVLPRRTESIPTQRTVEGDYFRIKQEGKPQSLSNDLRFRKIKGIVSLVKIDPDPELYEKDSIGNIINKMSSVLLETLGIQSNTEDGRSLFMTAYNGNVSSISETETHVIIEIDDFLYNEQLQEMEKFISKPDFGTTPYYLEFYPYRIPQTPYFERIPMNVPAHRQIYAPSPLSNSLVKELAFGDRATSYSIENNLDENGSAKRDIDRLGEDEARLRSAPPILKWRGNKIEVNYSGGGNPDRVLDLASGHPFRNGMRIPHQPNFARRYSFHTSYALGKTNGGLIGFRYAPANGQNVSNLSGDEFGLGVNSKPIIVSNSAPTAINSSTPVGFNGFELKHPFFERVNRSSWWLLEGSNSNDSDLVRNKSLRSKVQYNQALKFFVPTQSVAPSLLPLAQKNTGKTIILAGHSQLGGTPKTGDTYERIISNSKLNATSKPPLYSNGTPKPDLHGIILNMRHLRSGISNSTPSSYEYLYYMPKIPKYQHTLEDSQLLVQLPIGAVWRPTWYVIPPNAVDRYRIDIVQTGDTGKLCFLNSSPPRGGIKEEFSYPKIGRFLRRDIYLNDTARFDADIFPTLTNLSPIKNGAESRTMVDNYVTISMVNEIMERYNWGDVHPNIGMYLRITPEAYDSGGSVNDKGLRELYLWHFYGILPAWWHTTESYSVPLHMAPGGVNINMSIIFPGWLIFGGRDDLNGNICVPPVAYTNTLYPNQVTSRNIALVFLSSIFPSNEVKTTSSYMGSKLNSRYFNYEGSINNKIVSPHFYSYQEETLLDPTHTAWGLSKEAYDALTAYTHEEDKKLIPEMASLYWEDIRGTWVHDLYQEIGLNALLQKAKVDIYNAPRMRGDSSNTDSSFIDGDFSSLFMIGIDFSPEKIMKPGDTYAVYYPNQNALGSLSIDEYINTFLVQKVNNLKKMNVNRDKKYLHISYYGNLPDSIKGLDGNPIVGAEPIRDWVFKQDAHTEGFLNFSSWIEYFRKCVREYSSSVGINGFDGIFHPAEQNIYGLITGGGIIKGRSNAENNLDNLEIIRNGIPTKVDNAPQPSPQRFLDGAIVVGNTKGGNEWNNPKLNFPHKKSEKMGREYEAFKTNTTKIGKMFPVSKMNGIPYVFVGKTEFSTPILPKDGAING